MITPPSICSIYWLEGVGGDWWVEGGSFEGRGRGIVFSF
jgi:hypothetical protein